MTVNTGLAQLSDTLFTTAIATYSLAMFGYTAEYAFGRKGKVAATVPAAANRVLVGAGGPDVSESRSSRSSAPPVEPTSGGPGRTAGLIAIGLTILGAAIHLASILTRAFSVDRVPWGNMYEFATIVGLIAVVAFLLVLARLPQLRFLGMFVMMPVIVVMFLAGTVWYVRAQPLVPALQSYWLAIHVFAAATSEGILMTSAVLTGLYLMRARFERIGAAGGRFTKLGARLPASTTLDKAAYRAVAFAFPIYTFAVICGAIWAEAAWGRYWGWDPKEVWAFIAWVVYAAYLHARATAGWKGRGAAWINLLGFGAITFNFFVVNVVIAGLHSYSGL